ncbi:uncharacterized protein N7459_009076 [Penicillium hispanicum]|uniref:uncharacterized protein n=1 Tax=Penicillium hispanicum TaxID=1080232 RepID=UPI00253FF43A|nr:uncharacterized protein N7459_009076 [Penicillium hispanicum]KAJ5569646.1 hypothetical protein N7459_009076 [Penicillium hispanicum]
MHAPVAVVQKQSGVVSAWETDSKDASQVRVCTLPGTPPGRVQRTPRLRTPAGIAWPSSLKSPLAHAGIAWWLVWASPIGGAPLQIQLLRPADPPFPVWLHSALAAPEIRSKRRVLALAKATGLE